MDTNTENVETQARRMWDTRPVRLPRNQSPNAWFFGVCEGIAVRYQVSPVLVRLVVGLSVTLGGLGLWFYLAALLVLPRYGVPLSPAQVLLRNENDPRYAPDRRVGVRTLIVAVVLLLAGGVGSSGVTLGGVAGGVVVTGLVWWLLHQRLPVPPAGLLVTRPDADAAASPSPAYTGADLGSLTPAAGFAPPGAPRTTPPSWDPLGAAPFAWDLPEPPDPATGTGQDAAPAAGAGRRRRSPWHRLGSALLGVVIALAVAVAAAVALVAGGVWHGQNEDSATTSSRSFTQDTVPVTALDRDRTVTTLFADVDLDLTGLVFPTGRDTATVTVQSRFSSVDVLLPATTSGPSYRVRVDCARISAADVDCDSIDGAVVPSTGTAARQDDAPARTLTVEVQATTSDIRMRQRPAA